MATRPELESLGSLSTILADIFERPQLESSFTLYLPRLESANAALLDKVLRSPDTTAEAGKSRKSSLLAYVLGHVLANVILRYPGPLLSDEALCARVATTVSEAESLNGLFEPALYRGPFSEAGRWYWRSDVDSILERSLVDLGAQEFASFGTMNRAAAELLLGRRLARHACTRCQGENGGFFGRFTRRPVCERADCSVVASTWIPQGAQLCRAERDCYEERASLLGL